MTRIALSARPSSRKTRRLIVLLSLALLCVVVIMIVAGPALAGETEVVTSEGLEAPALDYDFVWWSFLLTFGLLAVYYVLVLRVSYTEFKKIVDAHFGPKRDGR